MNYFSDCTTVADVKALYRKLAKQLHPDLGGSTEAMKQLNAQYDDTLKRMSGQQTKRDDGSYHTYEYNAEHEAAIREKVDELLSLQLDGAEVWIIGTWVWVTNTQREMKDKLGRDGAGMRWNRKRKAWYWKPYEGKSYRSKHSLDVIAEVYGAARAVRTAQPALR